MITALLSRSSEDQDPPANSTSLAHENEDDVAACEWHVVAELCPIRERPNTESEIVETFSLGTSLRVDEEASVRMPIGGQERGFEWLKIIEPIHGWCRASQCSVGDYATLGASWQFVVVCQDGAFVREGLELASPHIYTLAKDAVFQVYERRVNEQGLARLRTDDGWLSEDLNPLSGQRATGAQPRGVPRACREEERGADFFLEHDELVVPDRCDSLDLDENGIINQGIAIVGGSHSGMLAVANEPIDLQKADYDPHTGQIATGLYGVGIAFPEVWVDPGGYREPRVGFANPFVTHLERLLAADDEDRREFTLACPS